MSHTKNRQQRLLREVNTLARAHKEKRREEESKAQRRYDAQNKADDKDHSKFKSDAFKKLQIAENKDKGLVAIVDDDQEVVSLTNNDSLAQIKLKKNPQSDVEILSHSDSMHLSDKNKNVSDFKKAKQGIDNFKNFNPELEFGLTAFDLIAIDLGQFYRSCRQDFKHATFEDRLTISGAALLFLSVFMPWISIAESIPKLGFQTMGMIHFIISILIVRRLNADDWGHRDFEMENKNQKMRISALYLILMSVSGILLTAWFFVYWGLQKSATVFIDFRFGAYVNLCASFILCFSVFLRWKRWIKEMHKA